MGFIYILLFLLKGEAPGELMAVEKAIHLPPNIFIWITFGLTILLLALFLKKVKRRIKFKKFVFFLFLFLISLIFIGVIGELDKKLWPKFSQIRIGKMEAPTERRETSLSNLC